MQFVRRKWGFYIVLFDRLHFKIKLLRFKAGSRLSYQYHNLRDELWLVLKGRGHMTANNILRNELKAGSYALVHARGKHKYFADTPTWVIEVQFGEKCTEQDIVRLDQ